MAFPSKVIRDIDFTNEVVVQCDVPDVKKKKKIWYEYLWVAHVLVLVLVYRFNFFRN